ncbi:hypothetical protein A2304_01105 [Candidatus Uhrbacteria bacterium RIFOXYB2_FULL_57_15]|uniref:DUF218 domain-containing protein n=1 Tax=Candidatus Uhrbacteria bacterium RIFOXYB2_FULL_57_15 TaxID=1802422 RepID=A0A1F7W7K2_9BACT|nr:MAG: hypothetical protein A2304_01105 [Candidatus Uhrbacteria bacterium RIFOXYB2_FULL_57_15]
MFCGPHETNEWSPRYHRVDHAIAIARETRSPLVIVGDAFDGRDVEHFAMRAASRGTRAIGAFDPGSRTLTDVRGALRLIGSTAEFDVVADILVVTDDWHAPRCLAMLFGERRVLLPDREIRFHDRSTDAGPRPPAWVKEGELRGIADYHAGRAYRPFGPPFGKPHHPTESASSSF